MTKQAANNNVKKESIIAKPIITKRQKRLAFAILAILIVLAIAYVYTNKSVSSKTEINTPIISRTELNKKPSIDIKLHDENEAIPTQLPETAPTQPQTLQSVITNLTEIEVAQTELKNQIDGLQTSVDAKTIEELKAKVAKLESLNGNIGNLSKIFLAQQLVLLDNAFKVGGNQNMAIENIYNFASLVAKDEKVAAKLKELLEITNKEAIITPHALIFYAQKLRTIKLANTHVEKHTAPADASLLDKIKAFLQSFIIIRKQDEVTADQQYWSDAIDNIEKALLFGDFITVSELLKDEKLNQLGREDIKNFNKLFTSYLTQQQALQATLGAFIEGYNYDY